MKGWYKKILSKTGYTVGKWFTNYVSGVTFIKIDLNPEARTNSSLTENILFNCCWDEPVHLPLRDDFVHLLVRQHFLQYLLSMGPCSPMWGVMDPTVVSIPFTVVLVVPKPP